MTPRIAKTVSYLLIFTILFPGLFLPAANAAMVGTETVLGSAQGQDPRERLRVFLGREDVEALMAAQGVDPLEAKARVDSLSDAEVAFIAGRLDQLPAGGNAVGAIIGAAVLILLFLLITDILGLTHVFTFVHHHARR